MAYEEKRSSYDEATSLEPIFKLIKQLFAKWWLIVVFVVVFAVSGFGVARLTYTESYTSQIIFNVSNKDKDVLGSTGMITSASDARASTILAITLKHLLRPVTTL